MTLNTHSLFAGLATGQTNGLFDGPEHFIHSTMSVAGIFEACVAAVFKAKPSTEKMNTTHCWRKERYRHDGSSLLASVLRFPMHAAASHCPIRNAPEDETRQDE